MGGRDEEEEKRDAVDKREVLEGPCPFRAAGDGKISFYGGEQK